MPRRDASFPRTVTLCTRSEAVPTVRPSRIFFEAQVRQAFANLEAMLAVGGCGFDDIVDMTTFHTDPENQIDTVMAVKRGVFARAPYPNWTAMGVTWLAGCDFEIKVIARVPGKS